MGTTLVCPRRDPSSLSTTATKRRMTRNRKIHPDNPNSIFLLTKKKKDLQHVRGGGPSGRTLSANTKKHKTAPPSVWRPQFLGGRAISSWFTSTKSKVSGA